MDIERIDKCITTLRELSDDLQTISSESKSSLQDALACTLTRSILLSYATYRSQGFEHLDALRQVPMQLPGSFINMPPIRFISLAAHANISTGKGSQCWRSALCLPMNTNFSSTMQAMCHLAVLRKSPYVQAQVENLTAPNDWSLAP